MPTEQMPPQEETSNLLESSKNSTIASEISSRSYQHHLSFDDESSSFAGLKASIVQQPSWWKASGKLLIVAGISAFAATLYLLLGSVLHRTRIPTGSYRLVEKQLGDSFFDFYDFYDGPDSIGSAGYNIYVSRKKATQLGLFEISSTDKSIVMKSAATIQGPRASIRLEGKRRYNHGLFVMEVPHQPAGCGVWPAFWLTDEDHWPNHGEIDILEGINGQVQAKTALHTSRDCNMFAHVPAYNHSGVWDRATGLYDTFTGDQDFETNVPADDCWNLAPHQWENQGCVMMSTSNTTLGSPVNERMGGGVYILEWDPAFRRIRSWVFMKDEIVPDSNLHQVLEDPVHTTPVPDEWGLPYAFFAIGDTTGCSADHFVNMHIVINLAFCGTVAGNRFARDCPSLATSFAAGNDPVSACEAYIQTNPEALSEAYWKIKGIYVYERD